MDPDLVDSCYDAKGKLRIGESVQGNWSCEMYPSCSNTILVALWTYNLNLHSTLVVIQAKLLKQEYKAYVPLNTPTTLVVRIESVEVLLVQVFYSLNNKHTASKSI